MHWIVQSNLFREEAVIELIDTLNRLELKNTLIKTIPFTKILEPEPETIPGEKIITIGSTSLARIAKDRGWTPGSYWNDNFNYQSCLDNYGSMMFNANAFIIPFRELRKGILPAFIRPLDDMKSFNGGIVYPEEGFEEWQENINRYGDTLTGDTLIVVAPPRDDIYAEYRFFVVDGKVVTGSSYKMGGVAFQKLTVPEEVYAYAQTAVDIWSPDRAFVLDIADASNGLKVIEINNLNSAGMYNCNVGKIIIALEDMENS